VVCLPFFYIEGKNQEKYWIGGNVIANQLSNTQKSPAKLFAEISTAYIEILAGVRRPGTDRNQHATDDYPQAKQNFSNRQGRFSGRGALRNFFCPSSRFRESRDH
jgi:hypothetical protein